ncbi:hypothetical protein [Streptomyces sp. NPDC095602]|uniref:hypothetical protein n=1 Tax=Streptomyces sp. NPDC095602 TaxID=3155819 RepID=UPI0033219C8E
MRHCAATLSLAAGVHMKAIQVLLGHSSFKLTADTYTSVLPQLEVEAAGAPVALVPRKATQQGAGRGRRAERPSARTGRRAHGVPGSRRASLQRGGGSGSPSHGRPRGGRTRSRR